MSVKMREVDLAKLNSLTKYPSIPTYHEIGDKGVLGEQHVSFYGEEVVVTEKIDGTNARVILLSDGYIIGSREELLYASGDLIGNPVLGIVTALRQKLDKKFIWETLGVTVLYFEIYGGNVTAASKEYTSSKQWSMRLFDVVRINDAEMLLQMEPSEISRWREHGGQRFDNEEQLEADIQSFEFDRVPYLRTMSGDALPGSIEHTAEWLKGIASTTHAVIDGEEGHAEGVVIRTKDRSKIAKIRHEDYIRTLKRRK
jgi:RNA ligase-like protein